MQGAWLRYGLFEVAHNLYAVQRLTDQLGIVVVHGNRTQAVGGMLDQVVNGHRARLPTPDNADRASEHTEADHHVPGEVTHGKRQKEQ